MALFDSDEARKIPKMGMPFSAGIVTGIVIKAIGIVGDLKDRFSITFEDKNGATSRCLFFGPNRSFCKDDGDYIKRAKFALAQLVNIVDLYYDQPITVRGETWPEVLQQLAAKFKEIPKARKEQKLRGVFVYNKAGFLNLRQAPMVNIEVDDEAPTQLTIRDEDIVIKPRVDKPQADNFSNKTEDVPSDLPWD